MTAGERNPAEAVPWQFLDAHAHALQLVILINTIMGGKRRITVLHNEVMDPTALAVTN